MKSVDTVDGKVSRVNNNYNSVVDNNKDQERSDNVTRSISVTPIKNIQEHSNKFHLFTQKEGSTFQWKWACRFSIKSPPAFLSLTLLPLLNNAAKMQCSNAMHTKHRTFSSIPSHPPSVRHHTLYRVDDLSHSNIVRIKKHKRQDDHANPIHPLCSHLLPDCLVFHFAH